MLAATPSKASPPQPRAPSAVPPARARDGSSILSSCRGSPLALTPYDSSTEDQSNERSATTTWELVLDFDQPHCRGAAYRQLALCDSRLRRPGGPCHRLSRCDGDRLLWVRAGECRSGRGGIRCFAVRVPTDDIAQSRSRCRGAGQSS